VLLDGDECDSTQLYTALCRYIWVNRMHHVGRIVRKIYPRDLIFSQKRDPPGAKTKMLPGRKWYGGKLH